MFVARYFYRRFTTNPVFSSCWANTTLSWRLVSKKIWNLQLTFSFNSFHFINKLFDDWSCLSLGNVIDPDHQIDLYHDQIAIKSTFLIRIWSRIETCMRNWLKHVRIKLKQSKFINFNQKVIEIDWFISKSQNKLTFFN